MIFTLLDKKIENKILFLNNGYYWNDIFLGKNKDNAISDIIEFKTFFKKKKFNKSLILSSANFFTKKLIQELFLSIDEFDKYMSIKKNNSKTVIGYFLENSLRTRLSYEKSCHLLGLNYTFLSKEDFIPNIEDFYIRGESEKDIILTYSVFCDLLIARHPSDFFPYFLDWVLQSHQIILPFINAGSGNFEHPTQAISDLYLISKYFNQNITICFFGDCKNIRSIRSLVYLISIYYKAHIIFLTPNDANPTDDVLEIIKNSISTTYEVINNKSKNQEILLNSNIIYLTRYYDDYILNEKIMNKINKDNLIMHLLPKDGEISAKIHPIKYPNIKYIEQMEKSILVKAVLIKYLMER